MDIVQKMLTTFNDDPGLLKKVITGDKSWVYDDDFEAKAQSYQWKRPERPRPKKAHKFRLIGKVFFTVFFNCNGVVHHEFLPQGHTVNKNYFLEDISRLREATRQKCTEMWKNQS